MMVRLFVDGLFMAAATLVLVQIGKTTYDSLEVGQTMALVGLALMNIFLALNLRFPEDSAFGSATFSNPKLLWAFAWAFVGAMLITQMRVLQDLFHTTPLDRQPVGHRPRARCRAAAPRRARTRSSFGLGGRTTGGQRPTRPRRRASTTG